MTPEEKLKSNVYMKRDQLLALPNNTYSEYVLLSDAIEILNEALRLQREKCLESLIEAIGICDEGDCPECDLSRPAILNAPQPEME